jgi:hypothetical protein
MWRKLSVAREEGRPLWDGLAAKRIVKVLAEKLSQ